MEPQVEIWVAALMSGLLLGLEVLEAKIIKYKNIFNTK